MGITVKQEQRPNLKNASVTGVTLRIYCNKDFTDTDGNRHTKGLIDSTDFFYSVACSVSGGTITIPTFSHPAPDTLDNDVRFSAVLYDQANRRVLTHCKKYLLPTDLGAVLWSQIREYNSTHYVSYANEYFTSEQTTQYIRDTLIANSLLTDLGKFAVELDKTKSHNINHGQIHQAATTYGTCFFFAFVKPTSTGYLSSTGYGGNHVLLFGFDGDATNGYTLTGNFFNTSVPTNISFSTRDTVRHNEWCFIALAYDGAKIACIINGVPSSVVAYTQNRYVSSVFETTMYIGGSDHNNLSGRIAGWGLFEGVLPITSPNNTTFRPSIDYVFRRYQYNGSARVAATVLADYRARKLEDVSGNGYHGVFCESTNQANTLTGDGGHFDMPAGINRVPVNRPQWVVDEFAFPTTSATALTPPSGAVIFDSFGRQDLHKGNYTSGSAASYVFSLGATEVGGKTWQGSSAYGILNGNAYPNQTSAGVVFVQDSQVNREVKLTKPNNSFPTGEAAAYQLVFNCTDSNNYNALYVDEYGSGFIFQYVAGVPTAIGGSFSFGTVWTTMSVIVSGTSVTAYADGVSKGTRTMTQNLTATGKGFYLSHPLLRVKSFTVL